MGRSGAQRFVSEVLRFEWRKLVLPCVMLLLLLATMISAMQIRAESYDEQIIEPAVKGWTDVVAFTRSQTTDTAAEQEEARQRMVADPLVLTSGIYPVPQGVFYWLFPLYPGTANGLLSTQNGYYLFASYPKALARLAYRGYEIDNLARTIDENPDEWTDAAAQAQIIRIEQASYDDAELASYAERRMLGHGETAQMGAVDEELPGGGLWENIAEGNITQVQIIHFIPSIVATFILYYLLSGVILAGYRRLQGTPHDRGTRRREQASQQRPQGRRR